MNEWNSQSFIHELQTHFSKILFHLLGNSKNPNKRDVSTTKKESGLLIKINYGVNMKMTLSLKTQPFFV